MGETGATGAITSRLRDVRPTATYIPSHGLFKINESTLYIKPSFVMLAWHGKHKMQMTHMRYRRFYLPRLLSHWSISPDILIPNARQIRSSVSIVGDFSSNSRRLM